MKTDKEICDPFEASPVQHEVPIHFSDVLPKVTFSRAVILPDPFGVFWSESFDFVPPLVQEPKKLDPSCTGLETDGKPVSYIPSNKGAEEK
ncbi:MAG: hypothetical protein JJT96_16470 [Opitutales bacterium]|nr:hypothetical protein [Opitutales bacterium]